LSIGTVALLPRIGFRVLYRPGRLGPRGVLAWIAGDAALKSAFFAFLPKARRIHAAPTSTNWQRSGMNPTTAN